MNIEKKRNISAADFYIKTKKSEFETSQRYKCKLIQCCYASVLFPFAIEKHIYSRKRAFSRLDTNHSREKAHVC